MNCDVTVSLMFLREELSIHMSILLALFLKSSVSTSAVQILQLLGYTGIADMPETLQGQELAPPAPTSTPRAVADVTLTRVPLVALDMPLTEILHQVQSTPLRRVIVVNQAGAAIGVIADRDILASRGLMTRRNPVLAFAGRFSLIFPEELFHRRLASGPLTALQVMRPQLYSVTLTTPVAEAVRLMIAHQIKRLVVVDETGNPLGMVDRQRLLRSLIESGGQAL